MKYLLPFSAVLVLHACMCTPSADSVRIDGLVTQNDTLYTKGSQSFYLLSISPKLEYTEGKKQYCLTYSKEMAVDIEKNAIVPSSVRLVCNQDIGTTSAGQVLSDVKLSKSNQIDAIINDEDLKEGQVYDFIVNCTTTDSQRLELNHRIVVRP